MIISPEYLGLGAIGALLSDIIKDGGLSLPRITNGKVVLGFLGSALVGAVVACIADNDPLTAISSGFMGFSLLEQMILNKKQTQTTAVLSVEQTIRKIAKEELVNPDLAAKVAQCESSFEPAAVNTNTDGSKDRGIFQINDKWHPEVTADQAFNVEFSTRFFCKAFKEGHLDWWNASKKCWE